MKYIFAVAWETAGAEDHEATFQSPKLILSSYIFNDRTISHFL